MSRKTKLWPDVAGAISECHKSVKKEAPKWCCLCTSMLWDSALGSMEMAKCASIELKEGVLAGQHADSH